MSKDADFRLPDTVKPKHYALTVVPDLDKETFSGTVAIDVDIRAATKEIVLNAMELDLIRAEACGQTAKVKLDPRRERATLTFAKPLRKGASRVTIDFAGKLSQDMRGFYKSTYTRPDGTKRTMGTTQFEAASARRAFPCFDEPELKATFEVVMLIPKDRVAISNTSFISEKLEGDKKRVTFARTPVMSTYLLAFVVGEFDHIEGKTKDGTPVRVYTTPGRAQLGTFALETAIRGIEYFNDYYAIPYRKAIDKCDLLAIPDFEAGAMENWGCITFREMVLFVDPEKTSVRIKRRVAEVVLHELAHQWFGNLVTMKWWDELWLNESFATFMAYKAADALFPEWKVWEEYQSMITSGGKSLDALRSSHPVQVPVRDPGQVAQIFDAISYNKGGSLLRMLEATIGADTFRDGIRRYLKKHAYANASTRDLWNALGKGVAKMMEGWTRQIGFPVVIANGKTIRQERFLLDRDPDKPAKDPTLWTVPINGKKFGTREMRLDRKGAKLNAGQTGFYLVKYDVMPRPMSLPPADRYGLIEDATFLMRAGYVSIAEFLDLVGQYRSEDNHHVWSQIASALGMLADIFVGDPAIPKMEAWVQNLLGPIVKNVGWNKQGEEPHERVLLRSTVLGAASRFGDAGVVAEARKRFKAAKKPEDISADLRGVVFGAVARHGDEKTLAELIANYERADLPEVKVVLLSAMGASRLDKALRAAFEFSLSAKVRPQDAMYTLAGTPIDTRRTAWALLKEHWKTLDERYGKTAMIARFIESAASGIPDEAHAKDVEAFFKKNAAPYATERIKQVVEGVRVRAKFRKRNAGALSKYFGS